MITASALDNTSIRRSTSDLIRLVFIFKLIHLLKSDAFSDFTGKPIGADVVIFYSGTEDHFFPRPRIVISLAITCNVASATKAFIGK